MRLKFPVTPPLVSQMRSANAGSARWSGSSIPMPRAIARIRSCAGSPPSPSLRDIRHRHLPVRSDVVLRHGTVVMPPGDLSLLLQEALEVPGDPAAGPPDALGERGFGEMVGLLHPHAAGQRADQALRGLARLP